MKAFVAVFVFLEVNTSYFYEGSVYSCWCKCMRVYVFKPWCACMCIACLRCACTYICMRVCNCVIEWKREGRKGRKDGTEKGEKRRDEGREVERRGRREGGKNVDGREVVIREREGGREVRGRDEERAEGR